jgi:UDP-GlcNAc3NAcA epimerase
LKKIITIVGARPQIIKSSAISRAVQTVFGSELQEIIVHTGQHYDENMSKIFFDEMEIPRPDYNLEVGSGSHGSQTAKMLEGLEEVFLNEKPDAVLVYGDTNSTVAGALAAVKIHIPLIHVEAGLRSYNKAMPEEINRIASDHMSTLLFSPTVTGVENLRKEGFVIKNEGEASPDNPYVFHCGDIMYDNSLYFSGISDEKSTILNELGLSSGEYILGTVHRDSNTDVHDNMENIFKAFIKISEQHGKKIVLPLHPRTKGKLETHLTEDVRMKLIESENILIIPPAGFLDIIALEKNASMIITDSGGLQKEAFFFEKPCIILRPQTEWVEIVDNGNAVIADASYDRIISAFEELSQKKDYTYPALYGDGKAAEFICQKIVDLI